MKNTNFRLVIKVTFTEDTDSDVVKAVQDRLREAFGSVLFSQLKSNNGQPGNHFFSDALLEREEFLTENRQ